MKTTMLVVTFLLALSLVAMSAMAAPAVSITGVKLGSDATKRGSNVTATFTVTNTGTDNLTSLNFSSSADSKYSVGFSGVPSSLAVNASATVTISAFVPLSHDAVNASLVPSAINIGSVKLSSSGASVPVSGGIVEMQAQNRLEVKKVIVSINGNEDSAKDGDDIQNIKPGDRIGVEVEVENLFGDKDDDPDINDVDVKIEVDDSDFDLDETEDAGDIGPDEEEVVSFDESDVDDEASDGSHRMTVTAQGRDDNGALHGHKITVDLEVERETHELRMKRADLTPTRLTCSVTRRAVDVRASAVNIGRRDEDSAVLEATIPDLGVTDSKRGLEVDRDDTISRTLTLAIPEKAKAGTYNVIVRALYDDTIETDSRTVVLTIDDCTKAAEPAPATSTSSGTPSTGTSTTQTNVPVTTQPPVTTTTNTASASPTPSVRVSSTSSGSSALMLVMLVVGIVVVLGLIGMLAYFGMRPKKPKVAEE